MDERRFLNRKVSRVWYAHYSKVLEVKSYENTEARKPQKFIWLRMHKEQALKGPK